MWVMVQMCLVSYVHELFHGQDMNSYVFHHLQGGFNAIENLIRTSPLLCSHALWLLCCLMYGNSYMKNEGMDRRTEGAFSRILAVLSFVCRFSCIATASYIIATAASHVLQHCNSFINNEGMHWRTLKAFLNNCNSRFYVFQQPK